MVIRQYSKIALYFSENESEAVKLAITNLRRDLIRTLDCSVEEIACESNSEDSRNDRKLCIRVGSISHLEAFGSQLEACDLEKMKNI